MTHETWRPIPGLDGRYEVSDQGRARSWVSNHASLPHVLALTSKGKLGHLMFRPVLADGSHPSMLIHRAVLAAFVGPCPDEMQVRHLDGDPSNNTLANLAYGTRSENELDKVRHGTHRNARKTHCVHGHEFTPENTIPVGPDGRYRKCRTCAKAIYRRRDEARRARNRNVA